jgi:Tol biopolymer transport system component
MNHATRTFAVFFVPALAIMILSASSAGQKPSGPGESFEKAIYAEEIEGNLLKAIDLFQSILKQFPADRPFAAKAQLHIGLCFEKLGKSEAPKAYRMVVDNYPDQAEPAKAALERLAGLAVAVNAASAAGGEPRIRKVWSGFEAELVDSVSPDGRFITYTDRKNRDLAIHNFASGENVLITQNPPEKSAKEYPGYSSWSPDGSRIAYQWSYSSSGAGDSRRFPDLFLYDVNQKTSRMLCSGKELHLFKIENWSLDGKMILARIEGTNRTQEMGLIMVSDGTFKKALSFPIGPSFGYYGSSLSPDGNSIAYVQASPAGDHDIFLVATVSGETVPLVQNRAEDRLLGWSPDGGSILFLSNRTGNNDIWSQAVGNGRPVGNPDIIQANVGDIFPLGINASGQFFYSQGGGNMELYTVKMDFESGRPLGQAQKISRPFENASGDHSLSPDGRHIAYVVFRDLSMPINFQLDARRRTLYLCIYSFDDSSYREIPLTLEKDSLPYLQWLDGKSVIFWERDMQKGGKGRKIDIESGTISDFSGPERKIFIGNAEIASPDGRFLFKRKTTMQMPFKDSLFRIDRKTGSETEIFFVERENLAAFVSPDGRNMMILVPGRGNFFSQSPDKKGHVYVAPLDGTPVRELFSDIGTHGEFSNAIWLPDSQGILLSGVLRKEDKIPGRGPFVFIFWYIPINGQPAKKLDFESVASSGFGKHGTDGRRISYIVGSSDSTEIWVMENFLKKKSRMK